MDIGNTHIHYKRLFWYTKATLVTPIEDFGPFGSSLAMKTIKISKPLLKCKDT